MHKNKKRNARKAEKIAILGKRKAKFYSTFEIDEEYYGDWEFLGPHLNLNEIIQKSKLTFD